MAECPVPLAAEWGERLPGQEYMLLFKDGRRLSTEMEITLRNKYASRNVSVHFMYLS
jgi:hypothetical protein